MMFAWTIGYLYKNNLVVYTSLAFPEDIWLCVRDRSLLSWDTYMYTVRGGRGVTVLFVVIFARSVPGLGHRHTDGFQNLFL